jgi:hypothetical protein
MIDPGQSTRLFWVALLILVCWDWQRSPTVDLRFEPPLIAAGSGKISKGGHCALPR